MTSSRSRIGRIFFPLAAGRYMGSNGKSSSDPNTPHPTTRQRHRISMTSLLCRNETLSLEILRDAFCFPACAGPNGDQAFPIAVASSPLYGWQTRGNSDCNGLQLSLRHAMSSGLQFDLNYTYSKSIDVGSNAERVERLRIGPRGLRWRVHQRVFAESLHTWISTPPTKSMPTSFSTPAHFGRGRHWGGDRVTVR